MDKTLTDIINDWATAFVKDMEPCVLIGRMTPEQIEYVYRDKLYDNTREDVSSWMYDKIACYEECWGFKLSEEEIERICDKVAEDIAYRGKHDCDLDYWCNISSRARYYLEDYATRRKGE